MSSMTPVINQQEQTSNVKPSSIADLMKPGGEALLQGIYQLRNQMRLTPNRGYSKSTYESQGRLCKDLLELIAISKTGDVDKYETNLKNDLDYLADYKYSALRLNIDGILLTVFKLRHQKFTEKEPEERLKKLLDLLLENFSKLKLKYALFYNKSRRNEVQSFYDNHKINFSVFWTLQSYMVAMAGIAIAVFLVASFLPLPAAVFSGVACVVDSLITAFVGITFGGILSLKLDEQALKKKEEKYLDEVTQWNEIFKDVPNMQVPEELNVDKGLKKPKDRSLFGAFSLSFWDAAHKLEPEQSYPAITGMYR